MGANPPTRRPPAVWGAVRGGSPCGSGRFSPHQPASGRLPWAVSCPCGAAQHAPRPPGRGPAGRAAPPASGCSPAGFRTRWLRRPLPRFPAHPLGGGTHCRPPHPLLGCWAPLGRPAPGHPRPAPPAGGAAKAAHWPGEAALNRESQPRPPFEWRRRAMRGTPWNTQNKTPATSHAGEIALLARVGAIHPGGGGGRQLAGARAAAGNALSRCARVLPPPGLYQPRTVMPSRLPPAAATLPGSQPGATPASGCGARACARRQPLAIPAPPAALPAGLSLAPWPPLRRRSIAAVK